MKAKGIAKKITRQMSYIEKMKARKFFKIISLIQTMIAKNLRKMNLI